MSLDITFVSNHCPHCGRGDVAHRQNITHNLADMAKAAGIYHVLWRPDENGIEHAGDLIAPLRAAIAAMRATPAKFKEYDSANGWGVYDDFLPWLGELLAACERIPSALIAVDR